MTGGAEGRASQHHVAQAFGQPPLGRVRDLALDHRVLRREPRETPGRGRVHDDIGRLDAVPTGQMRRDLGRQRGAERAQGLDQPPFRIADAGKRQGHRRGAAADRGARQAEGVAHGVDGLLGGQPRRRELDPDQRTSARAPRVRRD